MARVGRVAGVSPQLQSLPPIRIQVLAMPVSVSRLSYSRREKQRKEKSTPFGVNEMRSQVLNRTAQGVLVYIRCMSSGETCIIWLMIC